MNLFSQQNMQAFNQPQLPRLFSTTKTCLKIEWSQNQLKPKQN